MAETGTENGDKSAGDAHAAEARDLLAGRFEAVLSTHSVDHPGYPFGSAVPYALDHEGLPCLLLSHLSQHTRNLAADPRCGFTLVAPGSGDLQQRGRLSAVGEIVPIDLPASAERYFRYYPQGRFYHDELHFRFYRFSASRIHWNGGFATARWFSPDRVFKLNPLSADAERAVVEHMSNDHAEALAGYLRSAGHRPATDEPVVMAGIDADGMDLRQGERIFRLRLARPIASREDARAVLVEMASQ
jgi:putative heme iron utilization protein